MLSAPSLREDRQEGREGGRQVFIAAPRETPMLAANRNPTGLPMCKCGTDRTRREATPEREYTFLGTLYALWGGTPIPSRVSFRCVHCGVAFDACSDAATRRAFIM